MYMYTVALWRYIHTVVSRLNAHIQLIAPCTFIRMVLTFIEWLIELNAPAQLDVHAVVEQATKPIVFITTLLFYKPQTTVDLIDALLE